MKPLPLALLILISAPPHLHSQTPQQAANTAFQAQAGFRLQILPSGEKILGWTGRTGFTYFIQASPDLVDWTWAPNIEPGVNGPMSYQIGGPTARGFFRLTGTSQTAAAPDTADFDGDGLSNLSEITPRPRPGNLTGFAGLKPNIQTSPVDGDTDHDGLGDKWEQDNNLDPTDDGTRDIQNGPDGDPDTDGFSNLREQTDHTNPRGNATTTDSDGDGIQDIDDAVPGDRLIDWKKTPESSYILIDVDVPAEADSAQDLNDKGEILFDHGIWSGGDWISRQAQDGSGTVPVTNGAEYEIHYGANWFFNDSRHLLGVAGLTFTTTAAAGGSGIACPTFWPTVQSCPSLIYDTADMWDNFAWSFWPMGVSKNGDMAIRITRLRGPSPGTAPTQTIDRFDSSGARTGGMDGTGGYHPSGGWQHGDTTSSGWVASNLARESTEAQPTAAYKVGLWNDSNTLKTLPAEAEGWGYPIRVSDVPNSKIALVAGQWSGSVHKGRVFLSDANGDMKYSSSLSDQKIQLFAGDGTALTSEDKLWRNGKLIPLRKLCKEYGQLLDDGFHIFPLKSNKHGMYLIQAQNESGQTVTKLLAPIRVDGVDTTVNPAIPEAPDRGVDNISIRAEDKANNGHQADSWIMAPISRTNTIRFRSAANPSLPLHLSATNATFTPAVLNSPDQQVTVTGTGAETSESSLVVKIGGKAVSCPIKVKALKRRNMKIAIHAVGLNVVPPEIPVIPALGDIQTYLNSVFLNQLNADITVTPGPTEVPLSWDIGRASIYELSGPGSEKLHEGNGTFDFTGADKLEQEDRYINSVLQDQNSDINVYVLTRHFSAWTASKPTGAFSIGSAVGLARRTPRVILIDGKQNEIITTIAHEIGHCVIGDGHPDGASAPLIAALLKLTGETVKRGPAPHDGVGDEEWKKRLMYSATLPVAGKTMVKSEWDAAETWLKNRPRGDN